MTFPLGQFNQAIDRRRGVEEFYLAVWPTDLNICKARLGTESEVKAEIV